MSLSSPVLLLICFFVVVKGFTKPIDITFADLFAKHNGHLAYKWPHNIEVYDSEFPPYRFHGSRLFPRLLFAQFLCYPLINPKLHVQHLKRLLLLNDNRFPIISVLEVGYIHLGNLELYKHYFGPTSEVSGIVTPGPLASTPSSAGSSSCTKTFDDFPIYCIET